MMFILINGHVQAQSVYNRIAIATSTHTTVYSTTKQRKMKPQNNAQHRKNSTKKMAQEKKSTTTKNQWECHLTAAISNIFHSAATTIINFNKLHRFRCTFCLRLLLGLRLFYYWNMVLIICMRYTKKHGLQMNRLASLVLLFVSFHSQFLPSYIFLAALGFLGFPLILQLFNRMGLSSWWFLCLVLHWIHKQRHFHSNMFWSAVNSHLSISIFKMRWNENI